MKEYFVVLTYDLHNPNKVDDAREKFYSIMKKLGFKHTLRGKSLPASVNVGYFNKEEFANTKMLKKVLHSKLEANLKPFEPFWKVSYLLFVGENPSVQLSSYR